MTIIQKILLVAACAAHFCSPASAACGESGVEPCHVASGDYRVAKPERAAGPIPAIMFLHGYGGQARVTLNNPRLVAPFLARGYAVIAPQGLRRGGDGPPSWNFRQGLGQRDELLFFQEVIADAADRHGVDPDRVILSGFSAGGFMVNYLACRSPKAFPAYAPVSGGFWRPHPQDCAGPVRLFHTHGWNDSTVPLEGRILGGGAFVQGDIFAGLEIWRRANQCVDPKPSGFSQTGPFLRRFWRDCAPDASLEFALFPGGHTLPDGWADMIIDWYEGANE